MTLTKLYEPKETPARWAIFMSGSGTNGQKIIERYLFERDNNVVSFEPALVFTDTLDSNAYKIARESYKKRGLVIPFVHNSLRNFYARKRQSDLRDLDTRAEYDAEQAQMIKDNGIDCVALAGYDWVVSPVISNFYVTANVHPGNLTVMFPEGHKKAGQPRYIGLGWVPSAKAIMNGEDYVNTSVHIVTPKLDCGSLLGRSAPQQVPDEVLSLEDRTELLGKGESVIKISKFIRDHSVFSEEELYEMFPVYKYAKECQEMLKVKGDWVVFPQVIVDISKGRYSKDESNLIYSDNKQIPNGVQF